MKRWISIFCFICIGLSAQAQSIDSPISVDFKDLPLDIVLDSVMAKSGVNFSYNAEILPEGSLFTIKRTDIPTNKLLDILLVGTGLTYTLVSDQIIIRKIKQEAISSYSTKNLKLNAKVSGSVRSSVTKEPLHGVSVFINGTTKGTTSDQFGNYKLSGLKEGVHLLIFSYIGYETISHPIKIQNGEKLRVNSLMKEKVIELEDVEVTFKPLASEEEHSKYLRHFTREFIGRTDNAAYCRIENPGSLDFGKNENDQLAWAETEIPIIMNNLALGYRVNFDLEYFELENGITKFHTKARFENLIPENRRVKKRWKRNRKKTYEGSNFHFFKSLVKDKLRLEGFEMYYLAQDNTDSIRINSEEILFRDSRNVLWFAPKKPISITYTKQFESLKYLEESNKDELNKPFLTKKRNVAGQNSFERSTIRLVERDKIMLDNTGKVLSPKHLIVGGYWSWERMAELMPLDYNPKNDKL
ncbi:MAG: carboxypeptidase-like regulatory domain-containing protein [Cyclobacteriaceae bacterium]